MPLVPASASSTIRNIVKPATVMQTQSSQASAQTLGPDDLIPGTLEPQTASGPSAPPLGPVSEDDIRQL